ADRVTLLESCDTSSFCAGFRSFGVVSFFFQAEDGIRVATVTGVQTCALPIWIRGGPQQLVEGWHRPERIQPRIPGEGGITVKPRSEERRVGKECRSRGTPQH